MEVNEEKNSQHQIIQDNVWGETKYYLRCTKGMPLQPLALSVDSAKAHLTLPGYLRLCCFEDSTKDVF